MPQQSLPLEPLTVRELIARLAEQDLDAKIMLTDSMSYNAEIALYAGDNQIAYQDKTNSTGGDNVYGLFSPPNP